MKQKILIVEDDPFLGEMYVIKLKQAGFEADLVLDGETGLNRIKKEKPALVLLDVVLPKKDGFEILKEIKSDSTLKNIPVVLLTNLDQPNDIKKALSLGADDYIVKARFTPTAVIKKVKSILEKKQNNYEFR